MKFISKKPLIHLTSEEEKAIEIVAALLDEIIENLNDEIDFFDMFSGDELLDTFFDNNLFNCEVKEN